MLECEHIVYDGGVGRRCRYTSALTKLVCKEGRWLCPQHAGGQHYLSYTQKDVIESLAAITNDHAICKALVVAIANSEYLSPKLFRKLLREITANTTKHVRMTYTDRRSGDCGIFYAKGTDTEDCLSRLRRHVDMSKKYLRNIDIVVRVAVSDLVLSSIPTSEINNDRMRTANQSH